MDGSRPGQVASIRFSSAAAVFGLQCGEMVLAALVVDLDQSEPT